MRRLWATRSIAFVAVMFLGGSNPSLIAQTTAVRLPGAKLPSMDVPTLQTNRPIARLDLTDANGRSTAITAMAASDASGLICVGTADHQLRLIDARTMVAVDQVRGHTDRIRSVCFSPAGDQIASVGNDGRLQIWSLAGLTSDRRDVDAGGIRIRRDQVIDRTPALARVAYTPDGRNVVAVGFTKQIYVLGRGGGSSGRIACSHSDLRALCHDSAGRLIVAGRGGAVHVFDHVATTPMANRRDSSTRLMRPSDARQVSQCQTNPGSINDVAVLPSDGRIVCVCDDGFVSQYDSDGNQLAKQIPIGHGRLFAVQAIDSNTVAVAGSDDTIRLVDLSDGVVRRTMIGHRGSIVDLDIIDGRLISAGYDATIRVWRTGSYGDAAASTKIAVEATKTNHRITR